MKLLRFVIVWRPRARPAILACRPPVGPVRRAAAAARAVRRPLIRGAATAAGSRDRIVFDKLIQVLRFGCSYKAIADTTCSATTIRDRRDEWITLGVFAELARIARESYDRIVGLLLDDIAVDGCITKAPGGGECRRPVPGRPAQTGHETVGAGRGLRHPAGPGPGRGATGTTPRCWPPPWTGWTISARCPRRSPCTSTPATTRARPATLLADRGLRGEIAHKGEKAPIQASQRWHVERTNAWHNASTGSNAATNAARR